MSTGSRRLGKYELQERLGRGGMAEVWKALDTQLQRYVAIKFLHTDLRADPDFMTRFVREAQAIASLRHPNIVQIHDFQASTEPDNTAYMVMNYIEGPTLAEYIRNTSRIGMFPSLSDIVHLFVSISSAIDYAHRRSMIHRDIKPTNIMLDRRHSPGQPIGKPILMDFGIVKLLGTSANTLTGTGSLIGTPLYMSPEQAQGHPGNERSDIYSLGVILYEICTGVRPFQGDNPSVIMLQHISAIPTPPGLINPNIPPALATVILRSLAKDPAARFPTATSMAVAMLEALGMTPPPILNPLPLRGDSTGGITYPTPTPSNSTPVQSRTPSSPSFPISSSSPYIVVPGQAQDLPLHPQFSTSMKGEQHTPTTPTGATPGAPSITNSRQYPASITPVRPPTAPPPGSPSGRSRNKGMLVMSIIAAIIVLVGASLGSLYLLSHNGVNSSLVNPIVGHVYFVSSEAVNDQNSQGIDDELRISLHSIADPAPGKSYYAWLLGDENQNPLRSILLGRLTIDHGSVNIPYSHDQQHTNLLEYYSQFLITEEDAHSTPRSPSPDKHTWRYYASLPQTPDGTVANLSALDHIRNLLAQVPNGTQGPSSIDIQFLRNTYQVLTSANSAIDAWYKKDTHAIRNQVITILDYIDSATLVQQDVPAGTPLLVDMQLVGTPLLDLAQSPNPNSYFIRIQSELNGVINSPDVMPAMSTLATQVLNALPDVQNLLRQVRLNAKSLLQMTDAQLLQMSAHDTLNTLASEANSAYSVTDPSTNQLQSGTLWIHTQIQNLATFDIKQYP